LDLNDAVEDSNISEIMMQKDMVTEVDWSDFDIAQKAVHEFLHDREFYYTQAS